MLLLLQYIDGFLFEEQLLIISAMLINETIAGRPDDESSGY